MQFGRSDNHRLVRRCSIAPRRLQKILADIACNAGARGRYCSGCDHGRGRSTCVACRTAASSFAWCHHTSDFLSGQRPAQIGECPTALHEHRRVLVHIAHQKHALRQRRHHFIERTAIKSRCAANRAFKTIEHAHLVAFGLQAADQPRTAVRQAFVIEIHRILRGEHATESEGAALFEQSQHRRLRRWIRGRRKITENLIHVEERPQTGGARLIAHPGNEFIQDQGHNEHAFRIGQMRNRDNGNARLAFRRK